MSDEEKAINLLQSADIDETTGDVQWHTWYKGIDKDVNKAFDIAIRHMQAWDKVKEEINQKSNDVPIIYNDSDRYEVGLSIAYSDCLDIIDKNLQEVGK